MERTQEIFEKIEAYLNNTLSQEERSVFEKEMEQDSELRTEVDKHKVLHDVLSDTDTLAFKEKLVKISEEIKAEGTRSGSWFSQHWKMAATIAVILGIGSILWFNANRTNENQKLYAAYYEPFPIEDTTRGESTNDLGDALLHYAKGEYDRVITTLEELVHIPDQEQLSLYLGNSYMNTGEEQKAIDIFKNIDNNSKYYENAQWYLALTYLKLGDTKQLKPLLTAIINYNGVYKESATNLQTALKK
ncbi:lipopolysaccharide assembly protein LapB [Aquimarina sp. AU474]|uniref:tetratricopeptide repeat protein n=1 Tax=Aquimarina sp. AU474 TaxID=2108529 RepID=UPI000D68885B|nr:hypothetical protein [Aquimarina sp. AU474]